jgi:hypothetical protein
VTGYWYYIVGVLSTTIRECSTTLLLPKKNSGVTGVSIVTVLTGELFKNSEVFFDIDVCLLIVKSVEDGVF